MTNLSSLNPANAQPRARTNIVRCTANEVEEDAPLAVKEAWKFPDLGKAIPYWRITFEALDCAWPDGPYIIDWGTVLVDPDGKPLDDKSVAHTIAQAFAGLGIVAFPDPSDPSYDPTAIVGNCFEIERAPVPRSKKNRTYPLPTQILGPDYKYEGEVKVFTPRSNDDAVAVSAGGGVPVSVDIGSDTALTAKLKAALEGVDLDDDDATLNAIRNAGLPNGATLGGTGLLSLVMKKELGAELEKLSG